MIGIIGPVDSIELAISVAREEGLQDNVIARSYASIEEASLLAAELDEICQVLLFTGRAAFALGRRADSLRADLQFVPHSGTDLYRTLVLLVREHKGELPRVSLDTIDPEVVRESFEDLGLAPPLHVMPLDLAGDADGIQSARDIVDFHLSRYRGGDVDVCLTCLGSVYSKLVAEGVPAWRISHTKSGMREALQRAHLAERLAITETTQPAAVLIKIPDRTDEEGGAYVKQRRRLRVREGVIDFAELMQGRLVDIDDETLVVYTNRGTVEAAVSRLTAGHGGPLELQRLPSDARIGIGLGATVAAAEENAKRALMMGHGSSDLHVAFADGEILRAPADGPPATYKLRETKQSALRLAQQLGLGPLGLARLIRALRQLDATAITATELARAYGILPRSTRRILTSLQRAGIATPLGRQSGARAGRPQTVYRIDLERLIQSEQG